MAVNLAINHKVIGGSYEKSTEIVLDNCLPMTMVNCVGVSPPPYRLKVV
jgi:hypothetical protein